MSGMTITESLFDTCPLPGCRRITGDPREPCEDCKAAFGDMLRAPDPDLPRLAPDEFRAMVAERDKAVQVAYAAQLAVEPVPPPAPVAAEWTEGQCWVCERKRRCRPDPTWRNLPICRSCGREDLA